LNSGRYFLTFWVVGIGTFLGSLIGLWGFEIDLLGLRNALFVGWEFSSLGVLNHVEETSRIFLGIVIDHEGREISTTSFCHGRFLLVCC